MPQATINKKLHPWLLAYGIFYSGFSLLTFALSIGSALQGSLADNILVFSWLIFLVLFWMTFFERPFGKATYWKFFIPLLILADVAGILFLSDWTTATNGIWETLASGLFSFPLYLTIWWYAFTFLPSAHKHQSNQ